MLFDLYHLKSRTIFMHSQVLTTMTTWPSKYLLSQRLD